MNVAYVHSRKLFSQGKEKSLLYFENSNVHVLISIDISLNNYFEAEGESSTIMMGLEALLHCGEL